MDQVEEIWKDCVGWEGKYQVSNQQRVRSLLDSNHNLRSEPRIKAQNFDINGYKVCAFYHKKKCHMLKVHRLIAMAFIPNPNNKPFVNHINGIKSDNRLENLEWVTGQENMDHAHRTGLMRPAKGEASGLAIWTDEEVIAIKTDINNELTSVELFTKYPKLDTKHLYLFRKNKTWQHLEIRCREDIRIKKTARRTGKHPESLMNAVIDYAKENPQLAQWEIGEKFNIGQTMVSQMLRGVYKARMDKSVTNPIKTPN